MVARRVWYPTRRVAASSSATFGWQVHAALEAWTARADVKASILLAFQGGVLLFTVTSRNLVFDGTSHWSVVVAVGGVGLLVCATALAAAAVLPVLGSVRRQRREYGDNLIYFGHVRHWQPAPLAERMAALTPQQEVGMLSVQLVAISRLSWRKHRLLQISVVLTMVALVALAVAVVGPHLLATGAPA